MKRSPILIVLALVAIVTIGWTLSRNQSPRQAQSQPPKPTTSWHLDNLCKDIPLDIINSAMGTTPTTIKHGTTKIQGNITNYYCEISYPGNKVVFIAYELGDLDKHLESLETLEIPYKTLKGFHRLAAVETGPSHEAYLKVSNSAYISISSTKPLPEDSILPILHKLDK